MPARRKSAITASGSIVTRGDRRNTSRSNFAFADSGILDCTRGTRLLEGTRRYYDLRGGGSGVGVVGVGVGVSVSVGVDGGGDGSWLTNHGADQRGASNRINPLPFSSATTIADDGECRSSTLQRGRFTQHKGKKRAMPLTYDRSRIHIVRHRTESRDTASIKSKKKGKKN